MSLEENNMKENPKHTKLIEHLDNELYLLTKRIKFYHDLDWEEAVEVTNEALKHLIEEPSTEDKKMVQDFVSRAFCLPYQPRGRMALSKGAVIVCHPARATSLGSSADAAARWA